jgi:hypothetical protein
MAKDLLLTEHTRSTHVDADLDYHRSPSRMRSQEFRCSFKIGNFCFFLSRLATFVGMASQLSANSLKKLATPAGFEPATHSLEVFGTFNDFKAHSDKFLVRTWLEVALLLLFVGMPEGKRTSWTS